MLIVEELFLLLTKDDGATEGWGTQKGWGLTAAAVADLVLQHKIDLDDGKDPRVTVMSDTPTGNPALDRTLARLGHKQGKKLSALVQDRQANPLDQVGEALVNAGIVDFEGKQLLGLVPARYPTLNPGPEQAVRERLRLVLGGQPATIVDATLLSILQGLGVAKTVLRAEAGGLSGRELKARIAEAAANVPEGAAIKRAIDQLNMVVLSAALIPVVTSN